MVTNVEIARDLIEQQENNRCLEETMEEMKHKLEEVADTASKMKVQLGEDKDKGKNQIEEDIELEPNPPLVEEPFLKVLKALSGKAIEGIPMFTGRMDAELVMEWIEGMENHFECDEITEAQKVKIAKSRLRG